MPAVISSGPDQAESELASSTPQMENQVAVYPVSFQDKEPECTPPIVHHQQDQGNLFPFSTVRK